MRWSNLVPVISTYWPNLDVPNVTCQLKPVRSPICYDFMETLMLREPAQLIPCSESQTLQFYEAYKPLR